MKTRIIILVITLFAILSGTSLTTNAANYSYPSNDFAELAEKFQKAKEIYEERINSHFPEEDAERDKTGTIAVSFANLDAYLKSMEEQTGKTVLSGENFSTLIKSTTDGVVSSLKDIESIKDPMVFLLGSPLLIAILVFLRSKNRYDAQKVINRVNGKKSLFDFGDTSYSLNNNFNGFDFSNQQFMMDEMNRQFMEHSMNEAMRAVTPFDHGGYMQGYGFNPSDTMAGDMQRQMDSMNNMNNMGGMF